MTTASAEVKRYGCSDARCDVKGYAINAMVLQVAYIADPQRNPGMTLLLIA